MWIESGGIGERKWRFGEGWIESGRDKTRDTKVEEYTYYLLPVVSVKCLQFLILM